jgi:hypothetical protein
MRTDALCLPPTLDCLSLAVRASRFMTEVIDCTLFRIGAVSPGYFDDHPYWQPNHAFSSDMGCDPLLQSLGIPELLGLVYAGALESEGQASDTATVMPPIEPDSRCAQHCIYIMRLRAGSHGACSEQCSDLGSTRPPGYLAAG